MVLVIVVPCAARCCLTTFRATTCFRWFCSWRLGFFSRTPSHPADWAPITDRFSLFQWCGRTACAASRRSRFRKSGGSPPARCGNASPHSLSDLRLDLDRHGAFDALAGCDGCARPVSLDRPIARRCSDIRPGSGRWPVSGRRLADSAMSAGPVENSELMRRWQKDLEMIPRARGAEREHGRHERGGF